MPLTGELARIDDELRRAYDGDCWHGPPRFEILNGVTAAMAATRHPQLAHPIWALVQHVSAWVEAVMPHEAIQRYAYHAGQIALRKKLVSR